jgi:hypothetical protein
MSSLVITKESSTLFSLSIDGGEPIRSEANRLTTFGNCCNFKTANGANLILKQNILYSDITVISGGTFTFTSIIDLWFKLEEINFFLRDSISTPTSFTELLDTFSSFLGRDGQLLVVNESMQRIETIAVSIFSAADRNKLDGIETGAQVNVNSDWNETNPASKKFIENKPTLSSVTHKLDRFTPTGQICILQTGSTATFAYIDGYIQYPEQAGFESDLNTFTQDGDEVTFKTTFEGTPQVLINYYL